MSETLEDKLGCFLDGTLLADAVPAGRNELARLGIRSVTHSATLALEARAALSSPVLGRGPCFVGAGSYMNDGGYIRCEGLGVFIGRLCSIGRRVTLGAGAHRIHGLSSSRSLRGVRARAYTAQEAAAIPAGRATGALIIDSDVWVGDGAVVMPGIRIGAGAVVAANAIVTRDVAPYEIVGGVPAKRLRRRFPDAIVDALLGTAWWNGSAEELNARPLANLIEFLEGGPPAVHPYPTYRQSDAAPGGASEP
jgi:virginiamycin A acetyltransferase